MSWEEPNEQESDTWALALFLVGIVVLNLVDPKGAIASNPVDRPVLPADDGVNQGYLYGEGSAIHKGIDFSNATLGEQILAVAAGTVVGLIETNENACSPSGSGTSYCNAYGNYVLIRHTQRHYDATTNSMGFVYSLYLHLAQNSVNVNVNDVVAAQQAIAQGDDTGNSSGHHLHLQIIIRNANNLTLATIDSENNSRNPELWLKPLAGTTRLAGRVSDNNGNAIANLTIQGLQKSVGAITLLTYVSPVLRPDDLLFENFGTTDLLPGNRCLQASNGTNLGCHQLVTGRTTYVGLWPIYFPDVRYVNGGWSTTIVVRNNAARTAQVKTTFFSTTGDVHNQRTDTIAPNAIAIIASPTTLALGSALVVGTENIAAIAKHSQASLADLDNGIRPQGYGDGNFDAANTTLYAPAFYNNIFGGINSAIYLQNTEAATNNVNVEFIHRTNPANNVTQAYQLSPNERRYIASSNILAANAWVGSIRITADRAVAAKLIESQGGHTSRSYNAAASGSSVVYVPAAYKNAFGFLTGIVVQNLGTLATNVTLRYCERLVTNPANCPTEIVNVQPLRATGVNLTSSPIPAGWSGSVSLQSSNGVLLSAAVTNSFVDQATGSPIGGYDFSASGRSFRKIYLPLVEKVYGTNATTGFTIRNTSGGSINLITADYYDLNGNFVVTRDLRPVVNGTPVNLESAQVVGFHQSNDNFLANGWVGSVVINASANIQVTMREDTPGTNGTVSGYNGIGE